MSIIKWKTILLFSLLVPWICGGCQSKNDAMINSSTVKKLDLNRYMGTWYEIARFDHSFERNLIRVTANYTLLPNGKIEVLNQGYKNTPDGKLKIAKGKAKQPDKEAPGKLKVSFFLFFYADYYVLELDKDYQWALLGSSSDKYLWILSREPSPDQPILDHILAQAKSRGYDIDKLIWVEQ